MFKRLTLMTLGLFLLALAGCATGTTTNLEFPDGKNRQPVNSDAPK